MNPQDFIQNGKIDFSAYYEALLEAHHDAQISMLDSLESGSEIINYLDNFAG